MNRARDPVLIAGLIGLWMCALVPLWWPRFLPLLDMPNHLDAIAIWHRFDDPSWGYQKFYRLNLLPLPYWGHFFPVHLMAHVVPLEIANKLYLSAYAIALPAGLALLAARLGRDPRLALLTFPFVFNMNFSYGFTTFCAGLAVAFFALWVVDRFAEEPTRARAIVVALSAAALYLFHLLSWIYFGITAALLFACHRPSRRRIAAAVIAFLPSALLALYGFSMAADGSTAVNAGPLRFSAYRERTWKAIKAIPTRLVSELPDGGAIPILVVLAVCWIALLYTGRRHAEPPGQAPARRLRLEALVVGSLGMALLTPTHMYKPVDLWMIGGRFISVTAMLALLLPRGPVAGRRLWWLVPGILVAVLYPLELGWRWHRFDGRAQSFVRVMQHVPRGSSTLTLILDDGEDPDVDPKALPFREFHSYAQLLSGGYNPWALSTGFPMTKLPDRGLPAPVWHSPSDFRLEDHGAFYDFVLTKEEVADHSLVAPGHPERAPLVVRDGAWRLYRIEQRASGRGGIGGG